MSKIILFNMITVDGFFEGPNREIDWHNVDDEFNDFAIEQLDSAAALIFGRITYELMAAYWPTPQALSDDPTVAAKMNSIRKIVFSRTLDKAEWNNTLLIRGDPEEECRKLKQSYEKNIFIFGSASFASALMKVNLIDEYRIIVNPLILGQGRPLFSPSDKKFKLKLLKARTFNSGNVLLYYQPES